MVLMEWEKLWKLYKDCQPIKALYSRRYWYIWLLFVFLILAGVGTAVSFSRGWIWGLFLCFSLFLMVWWCTDCLIEKSLKREFTMLYT